MPIPAADLPTLASARTFVELREKNLALNLFDGSHGADWVAGRVNSVKIAKPNFNVVPATQRARGGNWAAAAKPDQASVVLARADGYSSSMEIDWEDAMEVPWPVVERYRSRVSYSIRHEIDTKVFDFAIGAASTTNQFGAAGTDYIDVATGNKEVNPGTEDGLVVRAIEDWSGKAYRLNAIDGDAIAGTTSTPFMIIHPELVKVLRRELRKMNLSLDALTEELLRSNVGIAEGNGQLFVGSLFGVRIFSWNHLVVPAADQPWIIYAAIPQAVAANVRTPLTQIWTPETNQVSDNPSHLIRQAGDAAWVEVEDSFHEKYEIVSDTSA